MRTFVLTSDRYVHCLPGFAYLFNRHCGARPALVMHYAVPPAELPENFAVHGMGLQSDYGNGKKAFSGGLRAFLKTVGDPLFVLALEDYFVTGAQWKAVEALAAYMRRRPDVGRIDLTPDVLNRAHVPWPERIDGGIELSRAADDALYQFSFQLSLWRRKFMLRFLRDGETPWRCEKQASKRIVRARAKGEKVPAVLGVRTPVIEYVNAVGGEGNMPDTWARKRFPVALWNELEGKGLL